MFESMQFNVLFARARTIEKKTVLGSELYYALRILWGIPAKRNLTRSEIQKQIHEPCLDHLLSI
jgi:hypothetical protein